MKKPLGLEVKNIFQNIFIISELHPPHSMYLNFSGSHQNMDKLTKLYGEIILIIKTQIYLEFTVSTQSY